MNAIKYSPSDVEQLLARSNAVTLRQHADVTMPLKSPHFDPQNLNVDLIHAAFGVSTESGEFSDTIKRVLFYGKGPITDAQKANLVEELGDLMWYIQLAAQALDVSIEAILHKNTAKLATRYKEKFSAEAATNRNLDAEKRALEEGRVQS